MEQDPQSGGPEEHGSAANYRCTRFSRTPCTRQRTARAVSDGMVTHVAGLSVTFGSPDGQLLRQRCAWCGALMVDVNLGLVSYPIDQVMQTVPTWEVFAMVRIDGNFSQALEDELLANGETKVPDDCCMWIDPAVTA